MTSSSLHNLNRLNLTTTRLVLREFDLADIESLAAYQGSAEYLEHYDSKPDAHAIVRQSMTWAQQVPRRNFQLAITLQDNAETIGSIGVRGDGYPRSEAEVGFEISPAQWRQGLASEALDCIIDFASNTGTTKLFANTKATNVRAQGLLQAAGFTHEATQGADYVFSRACNGQNE